MKLKIKDFALTGDLISVKRKTLRSFPKEFATQIPSFNLDIHRLRPNFEIGSLVGRNLK
jgi:hypothetical protein